MYHKADYVAINDYLAEVDWKSLFYGNSDVNKKLGLFLEVVNKVIHKFVPIVKPKTNKYPPWFSNDLISRLREKNRVRLRYKKYSNPLDRISYRLLTDRCKKLASVCYNAYIRKIEDGILTNPKLFWSYIKTKRGGSGTYPATMMDGNTVIQNGNDICNSFASYFFSTTSNLGVPCDINTDENIFSTSVGGAIDCFTTLNLSRKQIYKKLVNIDVTKGTGSDNISPLFISRCASCLVEPLFIIFNNSLSSGVFPKVWKVSKVVPVYKAGDAQIISNYRPISILSSLAKVFESLVCPILQAYFDKYLNDNQHGFTKGRSTNTNLVTYVEDIASHIDGNKQVDAIYTDFSKAFDRVVHRRLLTKLSAYGIGGSVLAWFESYLSERSFYVVVNGFSSELRDITSGVPQGSHLGPILFNIFVNDIPNCIKYSSPSMFADDLKLWKVIETLDDVLHLQKDLDALVKWCQTNGMELNINKCVHIKFTRKLNPIPSIYSINGIRLGERTVVRDLGVLMDNKMTFVPHIDYIIGRASKMLGFIIRNARVFKRHSSKIALYNSLVRSILEYGSVVWRPHYATHTLRIERIQKRLVKHLVFSHFWHKRFSPYKDLLEFLKMQSLDNRRDILDLSFFFKIIRYQLHCPALLIKFNFKVPSRMPRKPIEPLSRPFRKTVLGANSPVSRISQLYNKCGGSIDVNVMSLAEFKATVNDTLFK